MNIETEGNLIVLEEGACHCKGGGGGVFAQTAAATVVVITR